MTNTWLICFCWEGIWPTLEVEHILSDLSCLYYKKNQFKSLLLLFGMLKFYNSYWYFERKINQNISDLVLLVFVLHKVKVSD